jgi:hypothetical protein
MAYVPPQPPDFEAARQAQEEARREEQAETQREEQAETQRAEQAEQAETTRQAQEGTTQQVEPQIPRQTREEGALAQPAQEGAVSPTAGTGRRTSRGRKPKPVLGDSQTAYSAYAAARRSLKPGTSPVQTSQSIPGT